jgi:hypothetical protein
MDIEARFRAKYEVVASGCWMWTGAVLAGRAGGYGVIAQQTPRRMLRAHRVSWELHRGPIPAGLLVLHRCDAGLAPGDISYRRCVNPDHLYLGTVADNSADMIANGRAPVGERNGAYTKPHRRPHGERNGKHTKPESTLRGDAHVFRQRPELCARGERCGSAKLTDDAVREIRRRRALGETCRAISVVIGVSRSAVERVANGSRWQHVK